MKIFLDRRMIFVLLLGLFCSLNIYAQLEPPTNVIPGRVYERIVIPPLFETWEESYPIYFGDKPDSIDFDMAKLIIAPSYTAYEFQEDFENCHSNEPKDCMILKEIKHYEVRKDVVFMADTTQSSEFIWETFTLSKLIDEGKVIWEAVLYNDNFRAGDLEYYCEILSELGYYSGKCDLDKITPELKAAFMKFQSDNNIPAEKSIQYKTLDLLDEY